MKYTEVPLRFDPQYPSPRTSFALLSIVPALSYSPSSLQGLIYPLAHLLAVLLEKFLGNAFHRSEDIYATGFSHELCEICMYECFKVKTVAPMNAGCNYHKCAYIVGPSSSIFSSRILSLRMPWSLSSKLGTPKMNEQKSIRACFIGNLGTRADNIEQGFPK
eukprot:GHVU01176972.1.p1 GENE.GHVU01176972.1~~GHVU01176972.1.p1  ORF type:complete len:162 (-),score=9.33 GHVU01176972.1:1195-1680(-)